MVIVSLILIFVSVRILFRYDPDLDRWQKIANMNSRRIGVGLTCVNRLLFAVGGFDGQNRLASVEMYDPESDEWKNVAPMKTTRSGAGKLSRWLHRISGPQTTI